MLFLGVDPGMSGGLSCLFPDGRAEAVIMPCHPKDARKKWGSPLDFHSVCSIVNAWTKGFRGQSHAVIEHAQAMPKQGIVSTFNYGAGWGGLLCVFQSLRIPYTLVRPSVWKRKLLGDEMTVGKAGAIAFVLEEFPAINLKRTPRCTTDHDGMADAVCLAAYGKRHDLKV
jgi:crossover junction endodeoxyribonuclease RuvC